jgi:hypothetical protein
VQNRAAYLQVLAKLAHAPAVPSQHLSIGFTHTRTLENPKDELLLRLKGMGARMRAGELMEREDHIRIAKGLPVPTEVEKMMLASQDAARALQGDAPLSRDDSAYAALMALSLGGTAIAPSAAKVLELAAEAPPAEPPPEEAPP